MAQHTSTTATLRFAGGAGTVTGSKFLLQSTGSTTVVVDCGMFQGPRELRQRNWAPLSFDASRVDAVVLTHAHLDHVGYLPALLRQGFRGPVHATVGTAELTAIVLRDAARLQEEEAGYANRKRSSRHHPALPLFTSDDAEAAIAALQEHEFDKTFTIGGDIEVCFRRAGHILGSAWIDVEVSGGPRLVFSGDVGRANHPLLRPPERPTDFDAVVVESTYGDRLHEPVDTVGLLGDTIRRTAKRGGSIVIPSFAVDRTEVLLAHLSQLTRTHQIPELPIYVDSPMALAGLAVYRRAVRERWSELRSDLKEQALAPQHLTECRTVEESKAVNKSRFPAIIIASSGMATGGRVLHHLANRLPDSRNSVVLAGFQVDGTRGRQLIDGARDIKIFGEYIPVHAEIVDLRSSSVHADQSELLAWLDVPAKARYCFVVHGETSASDALAARLRENGSRAVTPRHDEIVRV